MPSIACHTSCTKLWTLLARYKLKFNTLECCNSYPTCFLGDGYWCSKACPQKLDQKVAASAAKQQQQCATSMSTRLFIALRLTSLNPAQYRVFCTTISATRTTSEEHCHFDVANCLIIDLMMGCMWMLHRMPHASLGLLERACFEGSMLTHAAVLQVESMQHMMHCVWAFFSWKEKEGRALEALMCSLRRKLYGSHKAARPRIDPNTCKLSCNVQM